MAQPLVRGGLVAIARFARCRTYRSASLSFFVAAPYAFVLSAVSVTSGVATTNFTQLPIERQGE